MKFIYDLAKNDSNLQKHGLPLSEAKFLDWDGALKWIDRRKDYGEERCVALVPMKQRLYCVVYVESKANNREIDKYEEEND